MWKCRSEVFHYHWVVLHKVKQKNLGLQKLSVEQGATTSHTRRIINQVEKKKSHYTNFRGEDVLPLTGNPYNPKQTTPLEVSHKWNDCDDPVGLTLFCLIASFKVWTNALSGFNCIPALKGHVCVIWLHLMRRRNVANSKPEISHLSHSSMGVSRKKKKKQNNGSMLVQYGRLLVASHWNVWLQHFTYPQ